MCQLLLRLKENEIDVLIERQKETVSLRSRLKVIDVICNFNLAT